MKILLLEDNATDADLTQRGLLRSMPNCTIRIAQTLKQAQEMLKIENDFDIALLDMKLPDGTGMEMLMNIRQTEPNIPVIILTGSGNEEVAVAALKAGANDYVIKNYDYITKLPGAIEFAIAGHRQTMIDSSAHIHVLYIEHHTVDIDLTRRHLSQYAPMIQLSVLPSAEEALEMLPLHQDQPCKINVILIDYRLPGLNALEFIKLIRQERKLNLPVILITGHGNEEVAIQSLKLGANEYLVKRENYLFRLPSLILSNFHYSELIKKQAALAESEEKYRLIADNSGDVIFTLDLDLNYTYISPSIFKLRGFTPEEMLNQNIVSSLTTESYKNALQALSNKYSEISLLQSNDIEPISIELELIKKDKTTVWTEIKATVILDKNFNPQSILGVTRDISSKKRYEEELFCAKEKAEESDRLKSAFLANMSHEIRTPMNGILGFAELLKEPGLSGEQQQEYIRIIEKGGTRMLNIINDIIDISKIESGQMKVLVTETNINQQLDYIYKFFDNEVYQKGLQLTLVKKIPNLAGIIKTDREKLYSILTNLIKNAIKYTPKGSIEFGCEIVETGHALSLQHARSQQHARSLQFFVKDTGIGIPFDRQEAIFERFIQADISKKQAFQGAGLGLAISKAYVEMLGGKIWVESTEGKGSGFYFTIPYHAEPELKVTEEKDSKTPLPANLHNKLKILIAEDDEPSSQLITIDVGKFASEIIQVQTGSEAVEVCRNNPDIDLVLMDIQLPEMDGYEATRQIRQFNPGLVIIAQTAYALSGDKEKVLAAGCNDYISKPFNKNQLKAIIEKFFVNAF
jgi:PAS domain S-box-containing protein